MEQRDHIEKQIEKIGLLLNKLFSKILKLNDVEFSNQIAEEVNTTLLTTLNINSITFNEIHPDDFIHFLQFEKNINPAHWEDLANIFYSLFKKSEKDSEEYVNTLNNCLMIYNYLEKSEGTFSFERNQKMNEIRAVLNFKK
ncbi:hypothetical protein [Flavobacterium sp. H122]|uniref:hypothetical protein n=1 Tax=Flavobacterium sp. H122 TaxID=2529860 RepID=UPI0010A9AD10|nr:hypothetical protein [Flavobacterium sp. H122]